MGHVFVVRGRLESIHCDAIIIPTDSDGRVEPTWTAARHGADVPTKFAGYARVTIAGSWRSVWFVDVTDANRPSLEALQQNLGRALADVSKALIPLPRAAPASGRERPLIALPILGVGGGGLRDTAGEVISGVLKTLTEAAGAVDVVLVAFRESDYAAVQWIRRSYHHCDDLPHSTEVRQLAGVARKNALSLLIGAGVSMGAGLPSWDGLLRDCLPEGKRSLAEDDEFKSLGALDQAEYIAREVGNLKKFKAKIAQRVTAVEEPALGHLLLASLGCHAVATTNYDRLYEKAATSQEGATTPKVLPYDRPTRGEPWLLKLHGDAGHVDDIVIARSDFVGYDARSGPAGALFQSMLMTSHLLAVGVSFADDNILRLTHEVTAFLRQDAHTYRESDEKLQTTALGTVLSLGGSELRSKIWKPELSWITIGERAENEADEDAQRAAGRAQARELEIFLDHLALHACSSSSYLLDERYASLVEDGNDAVTAARAAAQAVPAKQGRNERWKPMRDTFAAHGFRPKNEQGAV